MDRFSKLHPAMQLLFFIASLVLILTVNNPIFSATSLACALLYSFKTVGKKSLKSLGFVVAIVIIVSAFNMLFAHYGEDVLFTVKDVEFTLEAWFYGFNQGLVLGTTILWFSSLSRVMDSERVVYLFRFTPKLAIMFSMILGFIPRFNKKLEDIRDARLGLNGGNASKNKLKDAIQTLSVLISYSLESSIITADSMESRAYNPKAIRAGIFKLTKTDFALILLILSTTSYVFVQMLSKNIQFIFEPKIYVKSFDVLALICFAVLELLPTIIDVVEDLLWKLSNAKN